MKSSNYTVVLISHEYPPHTIGGIGSYCFSLANALARRHIQTIVLCGKSKSLEISRINDNLKVVRLPCIDVPPRYLWFQMTNFATISRLVGNDCVLHGVDPDSSAFFLYLKRRLKIPFITTIHEHPLAALKQFAGLPRSEWSLGDLRISAASYPLDTFLMTRCLRLSDHIVVPGEYTRDYLLLIDRKTPKQKVSVIYNGVDFAEIDGIESEIHDSKNLRITSYGRLVSTKGIQYLLKIMPKLWEEFPEMKLQLAGKGPLEGKIISQISHTGFKNNVYFRGFLQHSQLIREIKDSDVVVLPTFHEVGPFLSALETMACGKTLVVFDLCFTREFVTNMENGLMARALDVEDLYRKVSLALSDTNLRNNLGQNARDYVLKHHNWDILVERYVELYENALHY